MEKTTKTFYTSRPENFKDSDSMAIHLVFTDKQLEEILD